ncbi:hypothetical protein [Cellulomonas sp. PhB143]|uniref:hypothetical protein n=1 Tax=Cellulomonas sp. PhB143 TaxID=2485186 RepID=UPI0011CE4147|nr:hypothetical protein [Cellulomonas sp. PhB143]
MVLSVLLALLAVPARYVQHNVVDTQGYVKMVGPLASDPAVQAAVADALTDQVMSQLDVDAIVDEGLQALAGRDRVPDAVTGLGPVLANQIEQLVQRTADKLVASPQFAAVWVQANRTAHGAATTVIEGHDGKYLKIDDGVVSVPLDGLVERLKDRLVDLGVDRAADIQPQGRSIVLLDSAQLGTAQNGLVWFERVAGALPWVVLLLVAGAVWAAPRRRNRVVAAAGIAIAAVMAVLLVGVTLAAHAYVGNLPLGAVGLDATRVVVAALLDPLRVQLWWWFGLGLVAAAVAIALPYALPAARRRWGRPQVTGGTEGTESEGTEGREARAVGA